MSRASHMQVVGWEAESTWGENVTTFTNRVPIVGPVNVDGLVRTRDPSNRTMGYRNEGTQGIPGTMSGSFTISLYMTGHGSTTAGAVTLTEVETLLGYVFGIAASTGTGTTFTGSGTSSAPATTSASGLSAGGILFAGALGDSGGSGQAAVISSHSGSVANLLTALPGTPANAAVLYSSAMIYTEEIIANLNVQSLRFMIQSANLQYRAHGCFPTSVEITGMSPGEKPMINITFGVSWWTHLADSFPGSDTMPDFMPAPIAAGSCFFAARGTATRSTLNVRSFTLSYTLGMQLLKGPGGVVASQDIVGAVRTKDVIDIELVVDSEAATTTPTHATNWDTDGFYHLLYTLNGASTGQRVALYFPSVCYDKERPVQTVTDNINRVRLKLTAYSGPTVTTDLEASAFRMAWG